jgi:hypothetical protein
VYPKVSGLSHKELFYNNNKHSLRSNTKGYGGKTHWTESQNSDTIPSNGRELYHLQFSLKATSPETFGYTPYNPAFVNAKSHNSGEPYHHILVQNS